jgi:hypothetical protein
MDDIRKFKADTQAAADLRDWDMRRGEGAEPES